MRVLLVSTHGADRTYGGAERYVADLADRLRRCGHEIALLSAFPARDESAAATVTLHDVDWRESPARRYRNHIDDWIAAPQPRVAQRIADVRPDVVHTSNLPGISTGIWEQARTLGIPVVHTLHDYYLLCPRTSLTRRNGVACRPSPLLCGLRTRRLARHAGGVSVVIGVSQYVLDRHHGFFPAPTSRRVILPPLEPLGGERRPVACPPARIGYLGALTGSKGIRLLIEAAPELRRRGFELRIAGDGPLRAEIEATEHVEYVGRVDRDGLVPFLTSCDVGVVPSQWEEPGLTYVAFEWLAAGRPVLATERGGLAEAKALGGVVSFGASADELLATAEYLLRDEDAWRQTLDSVPVVTRSEDVDRWVAEHLAAYEAALATTATPAVQA
jgi:glycosyltransferase involved in cell wall biosynthesis